MSKRVLLLSKTVIEGDAVGNDVLGQWKYLRKIGIDVGVYARFQGSSVPVDNVNLSDWSGDKNVLCIFHHSTGWEEGVDILRRIKGTRVIKYHNITPAYYFFNYSVRHSLVCEQGRKANKRLIDIGLDSVWGDSNFNLLDFFEKIPSSIDRHVLPPFFQIDALRNAVPDQVIVRRLQDGKTNVLSVGRIVPNKGHSLILRAAKKFVEKYGRGVRFIMCGGVPKGLESYLKDLFAMTKKLGVSDVVEFTDFVSLSQLKAYYLSAHVFLALSEHEGFCVPLIEAQAHGIPIIARDAGAIGATAGKNQLIFQETPAELVSAGIHALGMNTIARKLLISDGYKNVERFDPQRLENEFHQRLAAVGV